MSKLRTSAWLHKFTIVYRLAIPGPLPHGRDSEGSANKPLPGQTDDRMILRERAFQIRELLQSSTSLHRSNTVRSGVLATTLVTRVFRAAISLLLARTGRGVAEGESRDYPYGSTRADPGYKCNTGSVTQRTNRPAVIGFRGPTSRCHRSAVAAGSLGAFLLASRLLRLPGFGTGRRYGVRACRHKHRGQPRSCNQHITAVSSDQNLTLARGHRKPRIPLAVLRLYLVVG